jgi:transcriptional regulator with XRE-family HTH domain
MHDDTGKQAVDCHIGARLRKLRLELGWKPVDLAIRLGILADDVEAFEAGTRRMPSERLSRLIDLVVTAKSLPRKPAVREVFDRSFLPSDAERIRSLGRG